MCGNVQAMGNAPLEHERTVCAFTGSTRGLNGIHATVHDCDDIHVDVK